MLENRWLPEYTYIHTAEAILGQSERYLQSALSLLLGEQPISAKVNKWHWLIGWFANAIQLYVQ